jgi:hypothetical protein
MRNSCAGSWPTSSRSGPASRFGWWQTRGWALWKTLAACAHDVSKADEKGANAWRILGEIFAEYEAGGRLTARVTTGA